MLKPGLYLSGVRASRLRTSLRQHGISRILNAAKALPGWAYNDRCVYKELKLADRPTENLLAALPDAIQFIEEGQILDVGTLVHCDAGKSRSVAVVVAAVAALAAVAGGVYLQLCWERTHQPPYK